jgi:hypothetical protein
MVLTGGDDEGAGRRVRARVRDFEFPSKSVRKGMLSSWNRDDHYMFDN